MHAPAGSSQESHFVICTRQEQRLDNVQDALRLTRQQHTDVAGAATVGSRAVGPRQKDNC